jgi:nucleotide-binding universal stress UspA family protein
MMNKILIPMGSELPKENLKSSIGLIANKTTDKIVLLHISTYPMAVEIADIVAYEETDIIQQKITTEKNELETFARELGELGYQVETATSLGFFDQEFVDISNRIDPDLILMYTSGSHGWMDDLFGTHTSAIFEKVKSPVLVIPMAANFNRLKKAVVSLSLENEDLRTIKNYIRFADERELESSYVKIDNHYQLDIINDQGVVDQFKQLYPGKLDHLEHRQSENVAAGLENYAQEIDADLIVLFTTKRDLIEKLFHKSVTKSLVLHSKKPLLIYHY